jgi:hypothetical protein
MLLQPLIGWLLDRLWSGSVGVDVLRIYTFESYRVGFSLMLVWLVIAILSIALSHETYAKQYSDPRSPLLDQERK